MKIMKQMLKISVVLCVAVSVLFSNDCTVKAEESWPAQPETQSPCVIVMEASTGTILYEKNADEKNYPASITKIMTAYVALENSSLDEVVTFSADSVYNTEGSGIARDVGEEMTMEECLYGMMLESSNECAYAIAEHVGGTLDHFVEMMNEKAEELGCQNTHFANPHGLHDADHYTSCHDMALIARAAWENEDFRTITGTKNYAIPPTNKHPNDTTYLSNHNKLLHEYDQDSSYIYPYCVGGKTGYTTVANSTLVSYATKDDMTLICVVMNTSSPLQWTDSILLYDYYLNNFALYPVAKYETRFEDNRIESDILDEVNPFVSISEDACIVLPVSADFEDTTAEITYDYASDEVLASIQYTYSGHAVGRADIVRSQSEIETYVFDNQKVASQEEQVKKVEIHVWQIVVAVIGIILLGLLIWFGKKFIDNFYIIKHKYFSRPKRDKRYKTIKYNYRSRRGRGRWRRW
ncbi:MAG: D-alanyl-D-alanine carboxypeptidase family protein [Roseburia sp.]